MCYEFLIKNWLSLLLKQISRGGADFLWTVFAFRTTFELIYINERETGVLKFLDCHNKYEDQFTCSFRVSVESHQNCMISTLQHCCIVLIFKCIRNCLKHEVSVDSSSNYQTELRKTEIFTSKKQFNQSFIARQYESWPFTSGKLIRKICAPRKWIWFAPVLSVFCQVFVS